MITAAALAKTVVTAKAAAEAEATMDDDGERMEADGGALNHGQRAPPTNPYREDGVLRPTHERSLTHELLSNFLIVEMILRKRR